VFWRRLGRAGGMRLISGRKAFQQPMNEGVQLLNAIQDVYLAKEITVAWASSEATQLRVTSLSRDGLRCPKILNQAQCHIPGRRISGHREFSGIFGGAPLTWNRSPFTRTGCEEGEV
jgi:hypothetical protein